jgi:hypothetical protein
MFDASAQTPVVVDFLSDGFVQNRHVSQSSVST